MSRAGDTPDMPAVRDADENFFQRFSRRKHEARHRGRDAIDPDNGPRDRDTMVASVDSEVQSAERDLLTDADMPDIETLDETSDYTGFLSAKVSESVRRAALRKLFHTTGFNVIDELDDYNEDFTSFEALGDIVTAEMRHRDEIERRRELECAADERDDEEAVAAGSGETDEEMQPATAGPGDEPEQRPVGAEEHGEALVSEHNLEGTQDDQSSAPV